MVGAAMERERKTEAGRTHNALSQCEGFSFHTLRDTGATGGLSRGML